MKVVGLEEISKIWSNKLVPNLDETYRRIKIVGQFKTDLEEYFGLSGFEVVDISEAKFIEEDKEIRLDYVTPNGPVYGTKTRVSHFDYLEMFLRMIITDEIILPPYAKRKHMNRIKDSSCIERVIVTDDSKLFSMKDGDVYNKKGTILVFKNKKLKKK